VDQNYPGLGREGLQCTRPAGRPRRHDQEADRHGARGEFVQLPIVDRLGGKKAFYDLAVSFNQVILPYIEQGRNCPVKE